MVFQEEVLPEGAGLVQRAGHGAGNGDLVLLAGALLLQRPVCERALLGSGCTGQEGKGGEEYRQTFHIQ